MESAIGKREDWGKLWSMSSCLNWASECKLKNWTHGCWDLWEWHFPRSKREEPWDKPGHGTHEEGPGRCSRAGGVWSLSRRASPGRCAQVVVRVQGEGWRHCCGRKLLGLCFSNFSEHIDHLGILSNYRFSLSRSGAKPRWRISTQFPGNAKQHWRHDSGS